MHVEFVDARLKKTCEDKASRQRAFQKGAYTMTECQLRVRPGEIHPAFRGRLRHHHIRQES